MLLALREALLASATVPELPAAELQAILRHSPRSFDEYRLARIAEWSQPRYALDKRFTRLTLLLDQGPEAQGTRWQPQPRSFGDLREVLAETGETALVLLGPPGCGKSTLLRRLELDLATAALLGAGATDPAPLTFLVPLARHQAQRPGDPPPLPREWLAREWSRRYPQLPGFDELLRGGRLVLLLDALNEMPHADVAAYQQQVALWRSFLGELPRGTRALFSCRRLDYSALLSSTDLPVPQLRIEALGDPQVEEFLAVHDRHNGPALWRQLRGTPQLDLFRSPFYLRLLLAQAADGSASFAGRAALFTGFVRQTLARELAAGNPLFSDAELLSDWDSACIQRHEWPDDPHQLPEEGILFPALANFARDLQRRWRSAGEPSQGVGWQW